MDVGDAKRVPVAVSRLPAREPGTLGAFIARTRESEPRETQVLFRIVAAVLALVAAAGSPPVHAQLAGRALVTDGDTVRLAGERVRLHGIDAPESKQACVAGGRRWRCGSEATRALARRIGGRPIACEERDRDRYGRIVAVCRVRGEDLNRWMVRQGWALAYRKYSTDYVPDERAARAAKRGLWRGDFVPPWRWRKGSGSRAGPPSPGRVPVAVAGSRGTSAARECGSTMFRVVSRTTRFGSIPRRASAGSARRPKPGRWGGGRRGGDLLRAFLGGMSAMGSSMMLVSSSGQLDAVTQRWGEAGEGEAQAHIAGLLEPDHRPLGSPRAPRCRRKALGPERPLRGGSQASSRVNRCGTIAVLARIRSNAVHPDRIRADSQIDDRRTRQGGPPHTWSRSRASRGRSAVRLPPPWSWRHRHRRYVAMK